ncbi:hypothetical protein H0H92_004679 [Tricholoma furcatifolium]|nr:hypothetical protein H0H92_004679 [Tricholoma furcatifolium]
MEVESSQADFLLAQTRAFRSDALPVPEIRPSNPDWDKYVVTGAAAYGSPMQGVRKGSSSGRHTSVICMNLVQIFSNSETYTEFLSYRGDIAQGFVDILQMLLDQRDDPFEPRLRAILHVALVRLCRKSELYPRIFSLTDVNVMVDGIPHSHGRFGDVYQGEHNKIQPMFAREAVVWGQLSHPNILPFLGIYCFGQNNTRLSLVSPWMSKGSVAVFLNSRSEYNRTALVLGAASGMQYLHENGVVHGDLKCLNILVTQDEQACLADFGHSFVTDAAGVTGLSSAPISGGTPGFRAPELVDPNIEGKVRRTEASDVFAFGMACYEMFAGEAPFRGVQSYAVDHKISQGQRPKEPNEPIHLKRGLTTKMWDLIQSCWAGQPGKRPKAADILAYLQPIIASKGIQRYSGSTIRRPGFGIVGEGQADPIITAALSHLESLID